MSQFAALRSNNIVGYVEDSSKGIVTIFLNSGGCCVLLAETVMNTLKSYNEEDLDTLFNEYVWSQYNESATITFGDCSIYSNIDCQPSESRIEKTTKVINEIRKSRF